jgi:hypothetical protein
MQDVSAALAGAARPPAAQAIAARRALVVGAGGALGAAVMEQLLGSARFSQVAAAITQPMAAAVRGFVGVDIDDPQALARHAPDTALVVFERERGVSARGREAALLRPDPAQLPGLAARLHAAGVRVLVVVVPHEAGLLPQSLQQGLATLDEAAVAAIGFPHLAFMRMAQAARGQALRGAPQRLARWMLSQLHWMVPQREQPVRAATVARVAAALALQLPAAAPGTRVWPAEALGLAAQTTDAAPLVARWLAGEALPAGPASGERPRL